MVKSLLNHENKKKFNAEHIKFKEIEAQPSLYISNKKVSHQGSFNFIRIFRNVNPIIKSLPDT